MSNSLIKRIDEEVESWEHCAKSELLRECKAALEAKGEPVYFKLSDDDHAEIPFIPPCPFCGGSAGVSYGRKTVDGVPNQPWRYFECDDCAATAEPEEWYKLTTPPSVDALIAEIDAIEASNDGGDGNKYIYVTKAELKAVTDKYRSAK